MNRSLFCGLTASAVSSSAKSLPFHSVLRLMSATTAVVVSTEYHGAAECWHTPHTFTGNVWQVEETGSGFDDLLFWTCAGRTPCGSGGHGDEGGADDGEAVRWRSSAFVAVSGLRSALKASGRDGVGVYPLDRENQETVTVADTRMAGQSVGPDSPTGCVVTERGLEREGLRRDWLATSATMGVEGAADESRMAGIYLSRLAKPAK